MAAAIAAERAWLRGEAEEPAWPPFPPRSIYLNRGLRIGGDNGRDRQSIASSPANEELQPQRAALWVRQLTRGFALGLAD